jgi:hypothetical protein
VARFVLTSPANCEKLALLHYTDTVDLLDNSPSWVSNFNSRLRATPLSLSSPLNLLALASESLYHASSDPVTLEASGTIRLKGRLIDMVDQVIDQDTYSWNYTIPPGMHFSCATQLKFEKSCCQLSASVAQSHLPNKADLEVSALAYCSVLVAGARRQGTELAPWCPSARAYKKWIWRITELADPNYDFMHLNRNPGVKVNWDFLTGKHQNGKKSLYTAGEEAEFHERFYEVCKGRKFFSTGRGMLGIGPNRTQGGDLIMIFCGAKTPFIVRRLQPTGNGPRSYQIIGEAYVHGIMEGEASRDSSYGKREAIWLNLV